MESDNLPPSRTFWSAVGLICTVCVTIVTGTLIGFAIAAIVADWISPRPGQE